MPHRAVERVRDQGLLEDNEPAAEKVEAGARHLGCALEVGEAERPGDRQVVPIPVCLDRWRAKRGQQAGVAFRPGRRLRRGRVRDDEGEVEQLALDRSRLGLELLNLLLKRLGRIERALLAGLNPETGLSHSTSCDARQGDDLLPPTSESTRPHDRRRLECSVPKQSIGDERLDTCWRQEVCVR